MLAPSRKVQRSVGNPSRDSGVRGGGCPPPQEGRGDQGGGSPLERTGNGFQLAPSGLKRCYAFLGEQEAL
eukprot:15448041-Alexandrium_andersonii.AAC.1